MHERLSTPELSPEEMFEHIWQHRADYSQPPVELPPNYRSSYNLPILLSLREIDIPYPVPDQKYTSYILGLFEDRSAFRPFSNLDDALDVWDKSRYGVRFDLELNLRTRDLSQFPVAPVEPVGWFILNHMTSTPGILSSYVSDSIGKGKLIATTELKHDPLFLSFTYVSDENALTVGFQDSFADRRRRALGLLPHQVESEFEDYDRIFKKYLPPKIIPDEVMARKRLLLRRLHTRKGLASLLLNLSEHLAKKINVQQIKMIRCSSELQKMVRDKQPNWKIEPHSANIIRNL